MIHTMSEESIHQRIKKFRMKHGYSVRELAKKADITPEYIYKIESGNVKSIGYEKVSSIAKALDMDIVELAEGAQKIKNISDNPDKLKIPKKFIPIVGYVNAGKKDKTIVWNSDGLPQNEPLALLEWREEIKDPDSYALEVKGDSMPMFEHSNWIVLVEPNREISQNDFVVARMQDGDTLFKQVFLNNDLLTLVSLNPKYPPLTVKKEDLHFVHRVSGMIHKDLYKKS